MCSGQACVYCGTVPFVAEGGGGFHSGCINVGYCLLPGSFLDCLYLPKWCQIKEIRILSSLDGSPAVLMVGLL